LDEGRGEGGRVLQERKINLAVALITKKRKKSHEREREPAARNNARGADESARDGGGAPCQ
jgi:hypothetical protein